jgi:hypothetical protein
VAYFETITHEHGYERDLDDESFWRTKEEYQSYESEIDQGFQSPWAKKEKK